MKNGLYRIEFGAMGNVGTGVITYRDGVVAGGDGGFAYHGRIAEAEGGKLSGRVEVYRHTPGIDNVFAGLERFTLNVEGQEMTESTAGFQGETDAAPGVPLKVSIQLLQPLQ